jgi:anti-sigma B factor antagonist
MLDTHADLNTRTSHVVVALRGELDATNAAGTARILQAAVVPQLRIIVDLSEVTFMDCRSVRELISVRAQVQQAGGALLLAGPQPIVRRLLSLLELIGPFPVFASAEEAINGGQESSWGTLPANGLLRRVNGVPWPASPAACAGGW